MLTMNEKDKNEMLEAILNENEAYQCKLWAVIMAGADTYALIGGLSTLTGGAAAALGVTSWASLSPARTARQFARSASRFSTTR